MLLDYQADRKNLKRWCEIILLASFVAEKSLLDPQRWDTSLLKLAISVTLLSLIQKGIEREKSFNFALCVFSPDHFCEKILPTASSSSFFFFFLIWLCRVLVAALRVYIYGMGDLLVLAF